MLESFLGTLLFWSQALFLCVIIAFLPTLPPTYSVLTVPSPKTRHTSALIAFVLLTIASSESSLDAIAGAR